MKKICSKCKIEKDVTEFHRNKQGKNGFYSYCKSCLNLKNAAPERQAYMKVYNKEYNSRPEVKAAKRIYIERNKVKTKNYNKIRNNTDEAKLKARKGHYLKKYNFTIEQFDILLAYQDNKCAICKTDKPGGIGTWHIDHDHNCCSGQKSCGKCIRGLLCYRCNRANGMYKDDPNLLQMAVNYLRGNK